MTKLAHVGHQQPHFADDSTVNLAEEMLSESTREIIILYFYLMSVFAHESAMEHLYLLSCTLWRGKVARSTLGMAVLYL